MRNNEPIRVAQIMGKWIGGGVESVVMNYYRHIDRTKIQFDFICDEDSTNIPYEEIEKLGGRVILIPPYQKLFKYHNKLKKILKDGNYKIVILISILYLSLVYLLQSVLVYQLELLIVIVQQIRKKKRRTY